MADVVDTGADVVALFAARVERNPDDPAVACGPEVLTYRELDERSGRLAAHLVALGVGPDDVVGVLLDRSSELIVGLLGVLKAGGAYLPLESSSPPERLARIVGDARPCVVLTEQSLAERLPSDVPTVLVDAERAAIAARPSDRAACHVHPDNLAYVIYTSGSTGQPKGVMIDHRALRDRVVAKADRYGLTPADRMLQFTSVGFDAAVAEIYPTLVSGACLDVHPAPARTSIAELVSDCERRGVTAVMLPPVMLQLLVDLLSSTGRSAPWLRLFLTGGESIPVERLSAWTRLMPHRPKFLYAYGPTETTVTATWFEPPTEPSVVDRLTAVPLGDVMPGTEVHVLDVDLRPVTPGEVGELWLTGAGLARGYLGDAALTAARFVPNPFGRAPGTRMYRTGDLVRRTAAGALEFVGRVDAQVKIRGFRVALGEIEAAFARHPQVSHVVVRYRDERLVAYYVPTGDAEPDTAELRRFTGRSLPDYMVPAICVRLAEIPLLPGGKVDHDALPEPVAEVPAETDDAELSPIEAVLCRIWCDLLGREHVGVADHFFDLGGDSLLANRMVSRIRDELGVELPMREVFRAPTVAGLAGAVTACASDGQDGELLDLLDDLERMSDDDATAAVGVDERAR